MQWKKEVARDFLALGSIPFFVLAIGRSLIGNYMPFVIQLVIAILVLQLLQYLGTTDLHLARGFIIMVFVALFYKEMTFTVVMLAVYFGMIWSALYLKQSIKSVIAGIVFGLVSTVIAYYMPQALNLVL